jgi:hypothetical protein
MEIYVWKSRIKKDKEDKVILSLYYAIKHYTMKAHGGVDI